MSISIREKITADIQKAKATGSLTSESLRAMVRDAVAEAIAEEKQGTDEIHATTAATTAVATGLDSLNPQADVSHTIVKDAIATVLDNLTETDPEYQEEMTAAIEGAVEGMSQNRRQAIFNAQRQVEELQSHINDEEKGLQEDINFTLNNLETTLKGASSKIKAAFQSAIANFRETEEFTLLQKRYAQLQAQLAILKANLTARYGERYEDVKKYLDDARHWYADAQKRAAEQENLDDTTVQRKQAEFEQKMGEAGSALARKEKQVRQILRELWEMVAGGQNAA